MKGGPWYRKIIYSSLFLALFPAAIIMLFVKPYGYRFDTVYEINKSIPVQVIYSDLDSDNVSERIAALPGDSYFSIIAYNPDNRFINQWNLYDSTEKGISDIFTGNFDRDKFSEVYVFTFMGDSLFLNLCELTNPGKTIINHVFITKIGFIGNDVASIVFPAGFHDVNGDGYDELYFTITSSFKTGPRQIFYYDIRNMALAPGPAVSVIPFEPSMEDNDNDTYPEIFGTLSAAGNYSTNSPFSDSSTWLMVFNDKLQFEFPPVAFPGFANVLNTVPYNGNYLLLHWKNGADTSIMPSSVMLYSNTGELIKRKELIDFGCTIQPSIFVFEHSESDRIIIASDKIFELDGRLELTRSIDSPFNSEYTPYRFDMNHDGEDELIIYSEFERKAFILNQDLRNMSAMDILTPSPLWKISQAVFAQGENKVFIKSGKEEYFLRMTPNNFYYLSFLTYPSIYLFIILFIFFIRRINTLQVVQKEDLKKRLLALQLQGIKAQLDPHFTFNTLNSVASMIYLKDNENAYDYMNKFTQLLRVMLNDAEKVYRTIGEEIQFVTTYFELEKLRFGDKFNYKVETGEGITGKESVPKLVLHTFAENAIKHGIMSRAEGGTVSIRINKEKNTLRIFVDDDGIGRKQAALQSQTSVGKGLKLTGEFYEILNQMNEQPVTYKIRDLVDDQGNPAGTRVEIVVPLMLGVLSKN